MNNYIYAYYQKIRDGSEVAGEDIRAWYELIIKGLKEKSFYFSQKKADLAILFIETYCRHHEGEMAPQKIKLELWEKALTSVIFGVVDDKGLRQFREIFIVIARKNGKTLLAAAIASYCLFLEGEYGSRVFFAAPTLDQAKLCYEAFFQMIRKEPKMSSLTTKRRTDVYVAKNNSSAMPLAFKSRTSDGFNPYLCIADEVASWPGANGLKFYGTLTSGRGARKEPLIISISSAGYENDGIFDELMKRSTAVLKGTSKEKRFAPFIYRIDDTAKWNDINELRKSNPNLGVSVSVDYMLDEIAVAEGSLPRKAEFLTKYCNIKQNLSQAWLSSGVIDSMFGAPIKLEDFRNCYCVGGIDLSQTTDLTSAGIIIERGGKLYKFAKFWLPEERLEEAEARDNLPYGIYMQRGFISASGKNFVDYKDCFNWFRSLVEKYKIYPLKVGYDRYSAQYLVQDMKEYGFHMDEVYQGDNLWPVIQDVEGLAKDGAFIAGDNDLLKIHYYDAAVKMSIERGRGRLVKLNPRAHIDGVAAMLDAMCVRQKYYSEIGRQLKNEPRA